MGNAKEIRTQIASVKSTQKITSAMEMVSVSKMRGAQNRMTASRPYANAMRQVISHMAQGQLEFKKHPVLTAREPKAVGYIVISSDRGLSGGLNGNLFKAVLQDIKAWDGQGASKVKVSLIGNKAIGFFKRLGVEVVAQTSGIGDNPSLSDLIGSVNVMAEAYRNGEIDRLFIVYNKFVNTMVQKPVVDQLLPLTALEESKFEKPRQWDYLYESDPKLLMKTLLIRYAESQVYQAMVENIASEQAARMVAMKAATDNATALIDELQLVYNKARQASITQELTEIVSGASAV